MARCHLAPVFRGILTACAGWITVCQGFRLDPEPLALGMTAQDAANSLRAPLLLVTVAPDAVIYVSDRTTEIAGLGPVPTRTFLQFRRGTLLGWTSGWQVPPEDAGQ
ncbi:MAG: hypothetical protein ACXWJW_15660 [Xanthobacteraceae bacterium]